jgi:hypothetical protein
VRRLICVPALLACAASALVALTAPAAADPTFHTERVPLRPVADAPLRSGFVVDVHAEGPRIYAQERYLLSGATLGSYQVVLQVDFEPGCDGPEASVPTAQLTTNAAGNAQGKWTFTPADAAGLPEIVYIEWQFVQGGQAVYATNCVRVALD